MARVESHLVQMVVQQTRLIVVSVLCLLSRYHRPFLSRLNAAPFVLFFRAKKEHGDSAKGSSSGSG